MGIAGFHFSKTSPCKTFKTSSSEPSKRYAWPETIRVLTCGRPEIISTHRLKKLWSVAPRFYTIIFEACFIFSNVFLFSL